MCDLVSPRMTFQSSLAFSMMIHSIFEWIFQNNYSNPKQIFFALETPAVAKFKLPPSSPRSEYVRVGVLANRVYNVHRNSELVPSNSRYPNCISDATKNANWLHSHSRETTTYPLTPHLSFAFICYLHRSPTSLPASTPAKPVNYFLFPLTLKSNTKLHTDVKY